MGTEEGRLAGVDDRRVGKADGHVVTCRPILLEVTRLADLDERIVGFPTVQSVGLEPLFTFRYPVGSRRGHHAVPTRGQVGNDCLARQRRKSCAVRFVFWADRNHARDVISWIECCLLRNRARI